MVLSKAELHLEGYLQVPLSRNT